MGVGVGIGVGLPFGGAIILSDGENYISAAAANGSTGGSAACANQTFDALKAIPALGFSEAKAYIDAATANSSSGGNLFCAEQTFQSLIDIA